MPSRDGLDKPVEEFLDKAPRIINHIAVETIAAVPRPPPALPPRATHLVRSYLGSGHDFVDDRIAQDEPIFYETQSESRVIPPMHGCPLQWSVYFSANCEFVALPVRKCLLDILDNAAKTMEIKQWKVSAEKLRVELGKASE